MLVLGIETSCDETGLAVYDSARGLLAHALHSQVAMHEAYGGVVPEIASRDHIRRVVPLAERVLADAAHVLADLDVIAYTQGPGLAPQLIRFWSAQVLPTALVLPSANLLSACITSKAICCRRCWLSRSLHFHSSRCSCRVAIVSFTQCAL